MSKRVTDRIKAREAQQAPKFGDPFVKQEGATIDRFTGAELAAPAKLKLKAKPKKTK